MVATWSEFFRNDRISPTAKSIAISHTNITSARYELHGQYTFTWTCNVQSATLAITTQRQGLVGEVVSVIRCRPCFGPPATSVTQISELRP